jgi:hypothetical protein
VHQVLKMSVNPDQTIPILAFIIISAYLIFGHDAVATMNSSKGDGVEHPIQFMGSREIQ